MKPHFFLFTARNGNVFFQGFIVLTVSISVNFRYIYSTNVICGQGIVSKTSREIFIFTKLPLLSRMIVEAEVRRSFLS